MSILRASVFVVRRVQVQRSAKFEAMGCTLAYCPLTRYFVSGSKCTFITTKNDKVALLDSFFILPK